jgi:hypothetical protein
VQLNDLLRAASVDPQRTLVLRHRPTERQFRKVLPLLAGDRLDLFDAYQSYQSAAAERSIQERIGGWVASFIAYGAGKAVYVGTYTINGSRPVTMAEFLAQPENIELRRLGNPGFTEKEGRNSILQFALGRTEILSDWRGKLVVKWPPPERSWYRRAHKNDMLMPVLAIREESTFTDALPPWNEVNYTWAELGILPPRMRAALEQWRGIYLIWDSSDGRAYVGSAYGGTNILGRWQDYAATGHGGNKLLRNRDPSTFRFTILERVSPDLDSSDVNKLEATWKERLHTRAPLGLNEN